MFRKRPENVINDKKKIPRPTRISSLIYVCIVFFKTNQILKYILTICFCREGEPPKPSSCFKESNLTPEQIAINVRDEIKRMKKRRLIVGKAIHTFFTGCLS